MHWGARKRHREGLRLEVAAHVARAGLRRFTRLHAGERRGEPFGGVDARTDVTVSRHSPRTLDSDNFVGGCKSLIDVLVREGLAWDDSPDYIAVTYKQEASKRADARTVVSVSWGEHGQESI